MFMSRLRGAFTLACLLFPVVPAYAQVVITQDSVKKGGITPDDNPGFPAVISRPGSYKFGSNITIDVDVRNAIQVTADNVTINLNGFRLSCANRPKARGISMRASGLTVLNGTINQCPFGGIIAEETGSAWAVIEGMRIRDNGTFGDFNGTGIAVGQALHLSNSEITSNYGDGVQTSSGSLLEHNIIGYNSGAGVRISGESGGTVLLGNLIGHNSSFGISTPSGQIGPAGADNYIYQNNSGGQQIQGSFTPLQPNGCVPGPCP